ncbi:hypothetical protein GLW04_17225 [Halobacillus litoralis]|uniref:Uncharacterized protein n=1 Tax=Halobacillus litoralis TaxID=45668 RepID=A0A845DXV6_9BACI|nr:hypothetical protein [Halobacillus litoralis]MYL21649.1 hypothetical protein [Halobacillus litoralis]
MSALKRMLRFYIDHFLIVIIVVGIALIMFGLQYYFSDMDKNFWLSLIPNFIADMIGILFTSYIITVLLQKSEEKKAKEKAYKLTKYRYWGMINEIGTNYVHLITRKPYGHRINDQKRELKDQISYIVNSLEECVPKDFVEREIEIHRIIQKGVNRGEVKKQHIKYEQFCRNIKIQHKQIFDEFIIRYIGFLPDDLKESLPNLESLQNKVTATPLDFGFEFAMVVDHEEYLGNLKEIGEELLILIDYFKDYEENVNGKT